ncbi:oligosaccharide flippase family protein [Cryobacterium sp. PH31-O1]|uniref:oligosaccharide flippase family protein n=1 Tax=Cryobacterium sp. PH31-O1 TaxID=3046306 RepID=UPI0024BB8516|nr:oligosaccharide flippase family protein [Cryobacterium sp. PH31-O1]MDJ0338180.1 oligosaccharide flippase family protein [Cryobacterium sp. PH31-O1]
MTATLPPETPETPETPAKPASTAGLGRTAGRGASTTLVGQLIRIGVQLGGIVVLGRLLDPSDYGLVASVAAIIGVGEVLRNFGLSSAAIQVRDLSRHQKDNLFWINSLIGLALMLLAVLCSPLIATLYGDDRLVLLTQVLAGTFLLNGLATQFRADLNRNFHFKALAGSEIGAQVGGLGIGIVMALNGFGYWALAGQQISQGILTIIILVPITRWFPGWYHRAAPMRHLIVFGSNLAGTQLLGYASRNTDTIVIGATLGAGPLGLYNRAFQLLLLPLNQINGPSTRVALPVLARLQDDPPKYDRFILLGQTIMLHAVTIVLAFSCAQALPIISIALGSNWLGSAPIFQILAIAGFFEAAAYATYWVFLSKGATKQNLYFALCTRPLLVGFVLLGSLWGVYGVAAGYSLGVALIWPIGLWWISRVTNAPARAMFLAGVRAILGYGFATGVSWGAVQWIPLELPFARVALGGVALLAAIGLVMLVWPIFRRDVRSITQARSFLRSAKSPKTGSPTADQLAPARPSTANRKAGRIWLRIIRRLDRVLQGYAAASALPYLRDRTALNRAIGRLRPFDAQIERWHVLVAPPGEGNIGDQAMVEAFLENVSGPVQVLVRRPADVLIPPHHAWRAELLPIPHLIYGTARVHRQAMAALAPVLNGALSLTVVGADIMDGAYSVRASARRADVASLARSVGVDARILGFSWNGRANVGVRRSLARAGRLGTRLQLRDPISSARARTDHFANVVDVADCVFAARTSSARAATEYLGATPAPYAVVNASALVGRSFDQTTEYARIVTALLQAGLRVVLLPHVVRTSGDDAVACRAVFDRLNGADGVVLVNRLLAPAEVRGLCAGAEIVLTGRMHLAVQAIFSAVPAVALSTQGKVAGLMRLFDTQELCVEPGVGLAERMIPVALGVLADRQRYCDRLAQRLPEVQGLAARNFAALPSLAPSRPEASHLSAKHPTSHRQGSA